MAAIASDVGQWGFRLFEKEKPSKVGEEEATKPSAEEVVKPPVIEESSSLVEEAIVVATEDKEAEEIKEETAPIEPVAVQLEREPSAAAVTVVEPVVEVPPPPPVEEETIVVIPTAQDPIAEVVLPKIELEGDLDQGNLEDKELYTTRE